MVVLGLDIGATNIKGTLLSDGEVLTKNKSQINSANPTAFKKSIYDFVDEILLNSDRDRKELTGIGVGTPGPIDHNEGVILTPVNMKSIGDFPIVDILKDRYDADVLHDNDANMAVWGEYRKGAGVGCEHLVLLTLGTGVGGGVIIEGEILAGATGNAGELGHITIVAGGRECNCGRKGCLEAYASGTAITEIFNERLREKFGDDLEYYLNTRLNNITPKTIFNFAVENKDALALSIYEEMGFYLGVGIADFINIFSPERVILTGGLMGARELFLNEMVETVKESVFSINYEVCEIVEGELGLWAGAIGAGVRVSNNISE